jgi:ribosomal protein S18 acetylase RimI-like enzyme
VSVSGHGRLVTAEARTQDGRVVASGVAAYADDWVGFRTIEVDPAERGRRLGLVVMAELLTWGAERGATTAYLQVIGDNSRAFALYDGLGFTEHHRYRYLAAP